MHLHLRHHRPSGDRPSRHWLRFWVLLLIVPACFALSLMPTATAAVAVTLTFGLPLLTWIALNVESAAELRARVTTAIRFGAGFSITCLGLIGLFAFSVALACATVAAYVVTVVVMAARGEVRPAAAPRSTTPTAEAADATSHGAPEVDNVVVTLDRVRAMTDSELCHAWRRSFVALQHATGAELHALVVHTRQLLLDEVESRHPAGLRAWLSSGANAAGGPDRFIGHPGPDGSPEAA